MWIIYLLSKRYILCANDFAILLNWKKRSLFSLPISKWQIYFFSFFFLQLQLLEIKTPPCKRWLIYLLCCIILLLVCGWLKMKNKFISITVDWILKHNTSCPSFPFRSCTAWLEVKFKVLNCFNQKVENGLNLCVSFLDKGDKSKPLF